MLVTALLGVWKGLLKFVFAFVAVVLGIIFGGYAGDALASAFGGGYVAIVVCSAILGIIIAFLIYLILTRFVQRSITWTPMVWVDRLGGLALGLAVGFTICGAISSLLGIVVTCSLPNPCIQLRRLLVTRCMGLPLSPRSEATLIGYSPSCRQS